MNKDLSGKKAILTISTVKWYLDNVDLYFTPRGLVDPGYESEIKVFLLIALGERVVGHIIRPGNDCWYISFKTKIGTLQAYFDRKSFKLVK